MPKLSSCWRPGGAYPPCLLIREPLEAVASATVFLEQEDPRPLLRFYNLFHERLEDYVDRLVVSDFPVTVNDFGSVIARRQREVWPQIQAVSTARRKQLAEVDRLIRAEHEQNMGAVAADVAAAVGRQDQAQGAGARAAASTPTMPKLLAEAQRLYEGLKAQSVVARPVTEATP